MGGISSNEWNSIFQYFWKRGQDCKALITIPSDFLPEFLELSDDCFFFHRIFAPFAPFSKFLEVSVE